MKLVEKTERVFLPAKLLVSFCLAVTLPAEAQIQLLSQEAPVRAISGTELKFELLWRNAGDRTAELDLRIRLFEASSTTAVPLSTRPWKRLKMLAGQTILETAELTLPEVQSKTLFIAQWIGGEHEVVGTTKIVVYPTNILNELKPLAGSEPVGLLDHANELKPILNKLAIEFVDLEESDSSSFGGRLAIVLQPVADTKTPENFLGKIKNLANRGVPVVWVRAPTKQNAGLSPSFHFSKIGQGTVLIAQRFLVSDLSNDPEAQLNLIRLSRFAVFPEHVHLDDFVSEP